jgi:hypothetical protein
MLKDFLALDAETVTNKIFELHKNFLNPKYIKRNQVKRLVEKVLAVCGEKQTGKENSDLRNKHQSIQPSAPVIKKSDPPSEPKEAAKKQVAYGKNVVLLDQMPDSERSLPSDIGSDINDL